MQGKVTENDVMEHKYWKENKEDVGYTLCSTKIKRLKFFKSQTGSDVSVKLAS
jgi:hypothetical protein